MGLIKRVSAFSIYVLILLIISACGSSDSASRSPVDGADATTAPTEAASTALPGLEPGWQRVQVRQGKLGRNLPNPRAGFTIDLPPGWTAVESWPSRTGAQGWIAANPLKLGESTPILRFTIGGGFKYDVTHLTESVNSEVRYPVIEGQKAILHLAKPFAVDLGPQVGIYFPGIPGGAANQSVPSLSIDGDSRGFVDQEQLARVLTSVRYAEISDLAELPFVETKPGDDWVLTPARTDWASFEMLLAPGWKFEEFQGIDSLVGRLTDGDVTLFFDFGAYSSVPYDPGYRIRDGLPNPPHVQWEEKVGDRTLLLVHPESGDADPYGVTGLFTVFEDQEQTSMFGSPLLSISGSGLDREQQETAIAMFRTVRLEAGYPDQK